MSKIEFDTISAVGQKLDESVLAGVVGGRPKEKKLVCHFEINTETCEPVGKDEARWE